MVRLLAIILIIVFSGCGQQAAPSVYVPLWKPVEDTPQLVALMDSQGTPVSVSRYLTTLGYSAEWSICNNDWTAPQDLVTNRVGCCTGFARYWLEWARRHDQEAYVVACWDKSDIGHAFALFRPYVSPFWYIGTNNQLWTIVTRGDDLVSAVKTGVVVLGYPDPPKLQVWDSTGGPVRL